MMEKKKIDRICDNLRMVRGKAIRNIAEYLLSGEEVEKYEIVERVGCDPSAVPKTLGRLREAGFIFATRRHPQDRTSYYKLINSPDDSVPEGLGDVLDTLVSDSTLVPVRIIDLTRTGDDIACKVEIEGFGVVHGAISVVPSLVEGVAELRYREDLRLSGFVLLVGGNLGIRVTSVSHPSDTFVIMGFALKSI